jgi:hypothetical protein
VPVGGPFGARQLKRYFASSPYFIPGRDRQRAHDLIKQDPYGIILRQSSSVARQFVVTYADLDHQGNIIKYLDQIIHNDIHDWQKVPFPVFFSLQFFVRNFHAVSGILTFKGPAPDDLDSK